jgi:hypothetical protein
MAKMEVRTTDACGSHLDQQVPGSDCRQWNFVQAQILATVQNSHFHLE